MRESPSNISENYSLPRERLKHLRLVLGLSQRQLAKEFFVTNGAISQWERGDRNIPGPVIKLLGIYENYLGMVDGSATNTGKNWDSKVLRGYYSPSEVASTITDGPVLRLMAGMERSGEILDAITNALNARTKKEFEKVNFRNQLVDAIGLLIILVWEKQNWRKL